jgi:ParB family transcriptional regulator, chromosome partitioning protein
MPAKLRGVRQAVERTSQIVDEIIATKAVRALKSATYIIRTESATLTPIDTSTLINSQFDTVEVSGTRILDGQHRYLGALRAIERGAPIVRIECKDFTGDEADKIAFMVSSSQGKQLDPFERAKAYTRLKGFGWTNEEIAKKVGRSVSDVQMHLSLGDVPAEVKARINAGQISYANAVAVTREHGDDAVKVIDEAVEEAKAQGKDKVTAKVLKSKKIKPVDRLIELLKPADHVILPAGHVVAEDEEFIQIPVADIHEVMAILEKM